MSNNRTAATGMDTNVEEPSAIQRPLTDRTPRAPFGRAFYTTRPASQGGPVAVEILSCPGSPDSRRSGSALARTDSRKRGRRSAVSRRPARPGMHTWHEPASAGHGPLLHRVPDQERRGASNGPGGHTALMACPDHESPAGPDAARLGENAREAVRTSPARRGAPMPACPSPAVALQRLRSEWLPPSPVRRCGSRRGAGLTPGCAPGPLPPARRASYTTSRPGARRMW